MTGNQVLDTYLRSRTEAGLSPATIGSARVALNRFFRYLSCRSDAPVEEVDPFRIVRVVAPGGTALVEAAGVTFGVLKDFVASEITAGHGSPASLRAMRKELARFFAWATEEGRIGYDPSAEIQVRPYLPPRRLVPSDQEVLAMMRAAIRSRGGRAERFTFLLWLMLTVQGLRAGEVVNLRVADLDPTHQTLRPRAKGAPDGRTLPLLPVTASAFSDYVGSDTFIVDPGPEGRLFCVRTPKGRLPITYAWLRQHVATAAQAARIGRPVRPHDLRHAAAALARGCSTPEHARQLLGHAPASCTDLYTHPETRTQSVLAKNPFTRANRRPCAAVRSGV